MLASALGRGTLDGEKIGVPACSVGAVIYKGPIRCLFSVIGLYEYQNKPTVPLARPELCDVNGGNLEAKGL
jgi:hypothetical protein